MPGTTAKSTALSFSSWRGWFVRAKHDEIANEVAIALSAIPTVTAVRGI